MSTPANYASIQIAFLALAGGLIMLYAGGEFLVSGASELAKRLRMSSLLIGLTIVAFGTSMPELFVGLIANLQNHQDIMIGNVLGSNIANVGLILGISALLRPIAVQLKTIRTELLLVLAATLVLTAVTLYGYFTRPFGLIFVAGLILYTYLSYKGAIEENKKNNAEPGSGYSYAIICLLIVFGLVSLYYGSGFFIKGAVDIARHLEISELVIGLTLAAVGTSLPELASSIAAIRRRQEALLVGNIVGSNLFNLLMVLGACAAVKPYELSTRLLWRDMPAAFLFTAVLIPLISTGNRLTRMHGLLLLLLYGAYLFLLT